MHVHLSPVVPSSDSVFSVRHTLTATQIFLSSFLSCSSNSPCSYVYKCSDLLFGNIYDTFSCEDNLSKAVFLEYLCKYIKDNKIRTFRAVVAKDFIGEWQVALLNVVHEFDVFIRGL